MSPHWSESDMASLRALYPVTNSADLVPIFRRNLPAIHRMARRHGIRKAEPIARPWSDAQVVKLTEGYPATPLRELVAQLGRSRHSVHLKARALGLARSAEFLASGNIGRTGTPARRRAAFLTAAAGVFSQPMGANLAEAMAATGVKMTNAKSFLFKAVRDGQLHKFGGVRIHAVLPDRRGRCRWGAADRGRGSKAARGRLCGEAQAHARCV